MKSHIEETGDFVSIDNQNFLVQTNQTQFEGMPINYSNQFTNNLNTVIGNDINDEKKL